MGSAPRFFDFDDRLRRLSDLGDQLEAYGRLVDFEAFRPELDKALAYTSGAHGGRPPFDPVMMLKALVIQTANNLSDERTEFLINDRPPPARKVEPEHRLPLSRTLRSSIYQKPACSGILAFPGNSTFRRSNEWDQSKTAEAPILTG